ASDGEYAGGGVRQGALPGGAGRVCNRAQAGAEDHEQANSRLQELERPRGGSGGGGWRAVQRGRGDECGRVGAGCGELRSLSERGVIAAPFTMLWRGSIGVEM